MYHQETKAVRQSEKHISSKAKASCPKGSNRGQRGRRQLTEEVQSGDEEIEESGHESSGYEEISDEEQEQEAMTVQQAQLMEQCQNDFFGSSY